jgi:membrane protease subunit (stomatin/prohibitin family)
MIKEFDFPTLPGVGMLVLVLSLLVLSAYGVAHFVRGEDKSIPVVLALIVVIILDFIAMGGFFTVAPNQSTVLTLFGNYKGSVRKHGLHWANPFLTKQKVSLRIHNFETQHLKVNDHDGNPIEIGAVVVWKVIDAAEAVFEVESYENYVKVQCEAALRNLATAFPYDAHTEGQMSLRANSAEIATQLKSEIEERLQKAGVQVIESRISHLAYAPEIATAMLQRQQASAIIAARQKIVEGAVGMVEMALGMLSEKGIVDLDSERKAAMVSNLLVVLCGERSTQPVVNTGTIYH